MIILILEDSLNNRKRVIILDSQDNDEEQVLKEHAEIGHELEKRIEYPLAQSNKSSSDVIEKIALHEGLSEELESLIEAILN